MPFCRKTKIMCVPCTGYIEKVPVEIDGVTVYEDLDLCKHQLGDAKDFELESLLDANVPLQQVNPKILGRHVTSEQLDDIVDGLSVEKIESEPTKE